VGKTYELTLEGSTTQVGPGLTHKY
jgi:hypothetical protein